MLQTQLHKVKYRAFIVMNKHRDHALWHKITNF